MRTFFGKALLTGLLLPGKIPYHFPTNLREQRRGFLKDCSLSSGLADLI